MRLAVRSTGVALLALVAAVLLAISTTMTSVALAATALIMGGTGHPLSVPQDSPAFITDYVNGANGNYIAPSGLCGPGGCTLIAVYTPEQFRFDTGFADMTFDQSVAVGQANLDRCIRSGSCVATKAPYIVTADQSVADTSYVVYGYSQSATVATVEKRFLAANPVPGTSVGFIMIANPNKPNGGFLERFVGLSIPFIGVTFNGATPTDTGMLTVDVGRQYDGWTDWPTNPLNLLADINAGMGIFFLHPNYFGVGTPLPQGQYGDTTYYLIPTPVLPLLLPLEQIPVIGAPLAVTADPFFRVLVEAGYNRTINPGQPTPAQWLYFPNPIQTALNLAVAVPTGLDNGVSLISGNPANRPFGTTIPGPYGVGGPPVDTGCGTPPCGAPTPYVTTPADMTSSPTVTTFDTGKLAAQPTSVANADPPTNVGIPTTNTNGPALPFNITPSDALSSPSTQAAEKPAVGKPFVSGLDKLTSSFADAFKKPTTSTASAGGVGSAAGSNSAPAGSPG